MTQGARLIDSTPPTRAIEESETSIRRLACTTASRLEPQSRLIVVAGTLRGQVIPAPGHPAHVSVVLTSLVGVAEQHLVHLLGIELRDAVQERPDDVSRQVVGPDRGQPSAVAAKGGPDGIQNVGGSHV